MTRSPILETTAWVERRAGGIPDPVERLRFLRLRTRAQKQRRRNHRRHIASILAGLVVMVAIVPLPTGTAETLKKERQLVLPAIQHTATEIPRVWLVDRSDSLEVYSNGLRIDLMYAIHHRPRMHFPIYSVDGGAKTQNEGTAPVGIVYHTTESNLAPFEEAENRQLKRLGRNLIELIRQERSYHYVIDRFGRVYRVVQESDAANHAGTSIWADSHGVYVNLNDSFLGISFEGQTGAVNEVTAAQVVAGKVLTEMLRARYGIATENCVTHAQVSVNPQNMRIGSHTDWANKFPFAGVGLPDNYAIPLASLYVFGFEYDKVFLKVTGGRWLGLDLAEVKFNEQAMDESLDPRHYRAILQHRYKDITSAFREKSQGEVVK